MATYLALILIFSQAPLIDCRDPFKGEMAKVVKLIQQEYGILFNPWETLSDEDKESLIRNNCQDVEVLRRGRIVVDVKNPDLKDKKTYWSKRLYSYQFELCVWYLESKISEALDSLKKTDRLHVESFINWYQQVSVRYQALGISNTLVNDDQVILAIAEHVGEMIGPGEHRDDLLGRIVTDVAVAKTSFCDLMIPWIAYHYNLTQINRELVETHLSSMSAFWLGISRSGALNLSVTSLCHFDMNNPEIIEKIKGALIGEDEINASLSKSGSKPDGTSPSIFSAFPIIADERLIHIKHIESAQLREVAQRLILLENLPRH